MITLTAGETGESSNAMATGFTALVPHYGFVAVSRNALGRVFGTRSTRRRDGRAHAPAAGKR